MARDAKDNLVIEMAALLREARPMMEDKCCHFDWCIDRRGEVTENQAEGFRETLTECIQAVPPTASGSIGTARSLADVEVRVSPTLARRHTELRPEARPLAGGEPMIRCIGACSPHPVMGDLVQYLSD